MKTTLTTCRRGVHALWGLIALSLGGCVVAPAHDDSYESEVRVYGPMEQGTVWVQTAPPPMRMEYPGYAPAVGYVWISGYWNWGGVQYLWVPGRWVVPRPGYVWVPHRWDRDGNRWRQDGGRWEPEHRSQPRHEREPDRYREPTRPWPAQPPSGYVRPPVGPAQAAPQERREAPSNYPPRPGLRAQDPETARSQQGHPNGGPSERSDKGLRAVDPESKKDPNGDKPRHPRRDDEDWRKKDRD